MLSLGNKEAIVNNVTNFPITYDTTNDKLHIKGFGSFQDDQLVSATAQRFVNSRNETMIITAPTAAELGITTANVPVTFSIRITTFRETSEYAINYILKGRPIIFEIAVSYGDDSAAVGVNILQAFSEWDNKFKFTENGLPFTYTNVSGAVTITAKDYTLEFKNTVEFRVDKAVIPFKSITTKFIDSGSVIDSYAFVDSSAVVDAYDLTDSGAEITTLTGLVDVIEVDTIGTLVEGDSIVIDGEDGTILDITGTTITLSNAMAITTGDAIFVKNLLVFTVDTIGTLEVGNVIQIGPMTSTITDITGLIVTVDTPILFFIDSVIYNGSTASTTGTFDVDAINDIRVGDVISVIGIETTVTAIDDVTLTVSPEVGLIFGETVYLRALATNPIFDGKYLEENVRMSLEDTNGAYSISHDERPIINGHYTTISFVMNDGTTGGIDGLHSKHTMLGKTRGELGGIRTFKYTLYFREIPELFTTGAGNPVFDILSFFDASPITADVKRLLGNGATAANAAAFVA